MGGVNVVVSTLNQTGSWAAITQGPATPMTKPVFNAFINHGVAGRDASSVAYAVLPNVTSTRAMQAAAAAVQQRVTVVANTRHLQVVCVDDTALPAADGRARDASLLAGGQKLLSVISWPRHDVGGGNGGPTYVFASSSSSALSCWNVTLSGPAFFLLWLCEVVYCAGTNKTINKQ